MSQFYHQDLELQINQNGNQLISGGEGKQQKMFGCLKIVNNFCFCCTLRTAVIVFSIIEIVLGVLYFLGGLGFLFENSKQIEMDSDKFYYNVWSHKKHYMSYTMVKLLGFGYIIIGFLLTASGIFGIKSKNNEKNAKYFLNFNYFIYFIKFVGCILQLIFASEMDYFGLVTIEILVQIYLTYVLLAFFSYYYNKDFNVKENTIQQNNNQQNIQLQMMPHQQVIVMGQPIDKDNNALHQFNQEQKQNDDELIIEKTDKKKLLNQ